LYGSDTHRGVFREGFWDQNTPFLRNFFNLLRFFKKKILKPPKFLLLYKKISNPLPQKISGYAPGHTTSDPLSPKYWTSFMNKRPFMDSKSNNCFANSPVRPKLFLDAKLNSVALRS